MLALLFGGDCHGLNIAIDLILTSVNTMVLRDDFINFIANLEKINWLIGVTEEQKAPTTAGAFSCAKDSSETVFRKRLLP